MKYMKNNNDIIAAIDLGSGFIKISVAEKNEDGSHRLIGVEKVASKGIKKGIITDVTEVVKCLNQASDNIYHKFGVSISSVYACMSFANLRTKKKNRVIYFNDKEKITKNDIEKLYYEIRNTSIANDEEILHIIPLYYKVGDGEIINDFPIGQRVSRLEIVYNLIIVKRKDINNIKKCFEKTFFDLKEIVYSPIALEYSVLSAEQIEKGVALVDFGKDTTSVSVYFKSKLRYTISLPIGSNLITKDIQQGCNVSYDNANKLKEKFGSLSTHPLQEDTIISVASLSGKKSRIKKSFLNNIVEARMYEILKYVLKVIQDAKPYNKPDLGIVISGGGSFISDIISYFKTHSDFSVNSVSLLKNKKSIKYIDSDTAASLGLIEYAFEKYVQYEKVEKEANEERDIVEDDFDYSKEDKSKNKSKNKSKKMSNLLESFNKFVNKISDTTDDVKM